MPLPIRQYATILRQAIAVRIAEMAGHVDADTPLAMRYEYVERRRLCR